MSTDFQPTPHAATLLARRVRYAELKPCTTAFIDARTPGSDRKENFTIIGPGVAESPDQFVHISEPHGFNIGGARQPPHCVNSPHTHVTEEVFVVHSGTWRIFWGEHGNDGEVAMRPGDVLSVPTRMFRGFENIGDDTGFLFVVLGGDDPGGVVWAPHVLERASAHGLVLLDSGRLIDTVKGEVVPDDARRATPISRAAVDALSRPTLADMQRCLSTADALTAGPASDVPGSPGVQVRAIIGPAHVEESLAAGSLDWPHCFDLRRVDLQPQATLAPHRRDAAEVWFVQQGGVVLTVDGVPVTLGRGDTYTTPRGAVRSLTNVGAEPAWLFQVLGQPYAAPRAA